MEILIATNNHHKVREIGRILSDHDLLLPADLKLDFSCDETGKTYYENALLKAETLYRLSGRPVLADDSGLSVKAMGGQPGIYSARFGEKETGRKLTSDEQMDLLLSKMENTEERDAAFICCMVLMINPMRIFSVQETFTGEIARTKAGCGGFGYDPVFFLPELNKTAAELTEEEKNSLSHRARAGKLMNLLISNDR